MDDELNMAADVLTPDAELDLTSEGFKVPRVVWTITEAEFVGQDEDGGDVEDLGEAAKVVVRYEVEATHDDVEYTVKGRLWYKHPNEVAQRIGRGQLKGLFAAAFGTTEDGKVKGTVPGLVGRKISAEGGEDKDGFRRLRGIRNPNAKTKGKRTSNTSTNLATTAAGL